MNETLFPTQSALDILEETIHLKLLDSALAPSSNFSGETVHLGVDTGSPILVSASLFSIKTEEAPPTHFSNEEFARVGLMDHPTHPYRYLEGITTFRQRFAGARTRLYLDPWLQNFSEGLSAYFDEIVMINGRTDGYTHGMLTRYLPIFEERFDWVICSGIDAWVEPFTKFMRLPIDSAKIATAPRVHSIPAGPVAVSPRWMRSIFGATCNAGAMMDQFLEAIPQHSNTAAMKFIDAKFLHRLLWTEAVFSAELRPILTFQVLYAFESFRRLSFDRVRVR